MTIVQSQDNRNSEWRASNIGSKMLEKMGWKEGDGIGRRNVNTTALRAVKRQEGLGIGAKRQTEGGPSASTGTFAAVLANLQSHHGGGKSDPKKEAKKSKKAVKKASKKGAKHSQLSLPANKVVAGHARKMRASKFGAKSAEDLACIFGNTEVVETALGGAATSAWPVIAALTSDKHENDSKKKRRSGSSEPAKKNKKSKKEDVQSSLSPSSSSSSEAKSPKVAEKKSKEKKEKKLKKEKKKKKSKNN